MFGNNKYLILDRYIKVMLRCVKRWIDMPFNIIKRKEYPIARKQMDMIVDGIDR